MWDVKDMEGMIMNIQGMTEQNFQVAQQEPNRSTPVPRDKPEESTDSNLKSVEKLDRETVNKLVDGVEKFLQSMGKDLNFRVDEDSNRIQVEVVDPKSNRIIRKIPADEIMALAASLEKMVGVFLNKIS